MSVSNLACYKGSNFWIVTQFKAIIVVEKNVIGMHISNLINDFSLNHVLKINTI